MDVSTRKRKQDKTFPPLVSTEYLEGHRKRTFWECYTSFANGKTGVNYRKPVRKRVKILTGDADVCNDGKMYYIRQCIVVLIPLEHLDGHWERMDSGTYRQLDNGEGDDIKLVTKKAKNVATDAASGDNGKSSISEKVELEKRAIKATRVWSSPSERMYILKDEKADIDRGESGIRVLRRVRIMRQEEVNFVGTDEDFTLGERRREEKKEETEEDGERKRKGMRQRGEVTPPPEVREYFTCHRCRIDFGTRDTLIGHLRMHSYKVRGNSGSVKSDSQTIVGVNCGAKHKPSFSREKGSERENSDKVKRRYGCKRYVCDLCRKGFDLKGQMQLHTRVHSGEKPFPCDICGKYYSDKAYLRKHKFIHVGKKPYMCEICGKAFTQSCGLGSHRRVHSGEKPYKCRLCGKRFSTNSHFVCHKLIHTGEKPHKCEVCGKKFRQSSYLAVHRRFHTGEKPYGCKLCDNRFYTNSHLVCHMRIHTGEKPYKCPMCDKCFRASSQVNYHIKVHAGEKP